MKNKFIEALKEFHEKFGHPTGTDARDTAEFLKRLELRMKLIEEEASEFYNAAVGCVSMAKTDRPEAQRRFMVEMIDGITDLLVVVVGTAVTFGIPLATAFERVHLSNMSKLGEDGRPIYRDDGKILKGPGFFPPRLGDLVTEGLEFVRE